MDSLTVPMRLSRLFLDNLRALPASRLSFFLGSRIGILIALDRDIGKRLQRDAADSGGTGTLDHPGPISQRNRIPRMKSPDVRTRQLEGGDQIGDAYRIDYLGV